MAEVLKCQRCGASPATECPGCGERLCGPCEARESCGVPQGPLDQAIKTILMGVAHGNIVIVEGEPPPRPSRVIEEVGGGSIGRAFGRLMEEP